MKITLNHLWKVERFSRRTISVSEGRRRSHNQEERGRFIFGSSNDWDICPFLFPYTSSTSSLSFLLLLLHLLNLHPFHLSDIILQKYSPPSSSTSPSPASPPVQVYLEVEVVAIVVFPSSSLLVFLHLSIISLSTCPGVFGSGGGGGYTSASQSEPDDSREHTISWATNNFDLKASF